MKNSEILKIFCASSEMPCRRWNPVFGRLNITDTYVRCWMLGRKPDGTRTYGVDFDVNTHVNLPEEQRQEWIGKLYALAEAHDWTISIERGHSDSHTVYDVCFVEQGDSDEERNQRANVVRTFRVYGNEGHRQRESFRESFNFSCQHSEETVYFKVRNADLTGTNNYAEVEVRSVSAYQCAKALVGQVEDGIFENSRVGCINELVDGKEIPADIFDAVYGNS